MMPDLRYSAISIRNSLLAGFAVVGTVVGGVGGWAATTDIAGAIVASGALVVDSNVRKVQHPTGGVVGAILARDGDRVKAGDVMVKLDDTVTRANLAVVTKGLDENMARKARLVAERDEAPSVIFPDHLLVRAGQPDLLHILSGEIKLFELRRAARSGQKSQMRQRAAQYGQEVEGLIAQAAAKGQEVLLIQRELKGARELWDKKLMPITKLTQLEREATRLDGERGQLQSNAAQSRGKIAEMEIQIGQIDRDLVSEVAKELRDIDAKVGELVERKVAGEDQLKRVDIRAPIDGVVYQSAVHTVGGVVTNGESMMLVVPDGDLLMVEAKVAPQDIDQVKMGQPALLRFANFNQRTTPEVNGVVARISADAGSDQRTGATFYVTRISLSPEEVARLGDVKLAPGMPVEAFIKTGDRKVLTYLVKPMHDQIMRAFRER